MYVLRRVLIIIALLVAWASVGSDRVPLPLTISEASAATARGNGDDAEEKGGKPQQHDLSAMRVFSKVIIYVKDNYVDPRRVKPKEMMVSALEYVEKQVPDVMVDGNADTGKLKLNVNGKLKEFDISHVDSLWKMSFTLRDVFD